MKIFTRDDKDIDMRILQHIPKIITEEDNDFLITAPTQEEVKEVVFSMDPNSTSGSDGFNRFFFQKFWDIIKDDITDKVKELINGEQMPKFFTSTYLVKLRRLKPF